MNKPLRNLIFVSAATLFSSALWAAPANPRPHTILQPDGTELTICLHGDEFGSYTTTDDGLLIVQNENGEYEYAYFAEQEQAICTLGVKANPASRRTVAEQQLAEKCRPLPKEKMLQKLVKQQNIRPKAVGTRFFPPKILVIMVNYSDVTFSAENTKAAVDSMFNSDAYHYDGAVGSVQQFFSDQSNGAYKPQFTVVGPYTLPNKQAYYGADSGSKKDARVGDLVMDACKLAANDVDFSDYDSNNDKFVDGVYVLYAGRGQADNGGDDTVWPKNWDMVSTLYYGYAENASQYVSGTTVTCPTYNGVRVNEYVVSQELRRGNVRAGIGTACHEFSHVLGLPDIYSTGTSSVEKQTPKNWDVMDIGMYNNNGITPPNHSVWERYWLGWVEPRLLNTAQKVVMQPNRFDCAKITNDGKMRTIYSTDTIYYLENRQNTGWDEYLPGHGLLVMRVKYNSTDWKNNQVNVSSLRYTIVRADGSTEGSSGANSFPGTKNVTTFVPFASYPLNDITEIDGNITFKFIYCDTAHQFGIEFYSENCVEPTVPDSIARGETLVLQIEPNKGYEIKSADEFAISMKTCGVERMLVANNNYTYEDNTLTIPNVVGDLIVMVSATPKTVTPTGLAAAQQGLQVRAVSAAAGLQLVGLPDAAQIRIFDAVGRLLINEKATANEQTYALRSGLYLIQVSAQGQTTILKAIR